MKLLVLAILLLPVCGGAADKKKKQLEIEVVETTAQRENGLIALDGRVRNTGDKPIERLIILFDFLAPGGAVITTQRFNVDEEVLEVGKDATIRAQMVDHVRAVRYRVNAVDEAGHDLRVNKPGPYVIE